MFPNICWHLQSLLLINYIKHAKNWLIYENIEDSIIISLLGVSPDSLFLLDFDHIDEDRVLSFWDEKSLKVKTKLLSLDLYNDLMYFKNSKNLRKSKAIMRS